MRLLHPALWTLLRLRAMGGVRRSLHALRSLRSALTYLLGLSFLAMVIAAVIDGRVLLARVEPQRLAALYQSGLLTFLLVGQIKTLGDRAVYFSPSEVDFLFSAPFSRRELIVYRVISALGGIFVVSGLLTALIVSLGGWWPAAFIGAFLSFLLLHLLAMCLATLRETVEVHAFSVARRAFVLVVLVVVAVSIAYAVNAQSGQPFAPLTAAALKPGLDSPGVLDAAYGSWTMRVLLAPFVPLSEIVTALSFDRTVFGWIGIGLLMNAGAFALLVRLDARNPHADLGRRNVRQSQRLRDGWNHRPRAVPLPSPLLQMPRLRGAGMIAAMQLSCAMRGHRLLAELALVVLFIAGLFHLSPAGGRVSGAVDLNTLVYVTVWTTVIISNPLRFDFRGGVRHLEYLKTLPVPAWAICAGELVTPVLITLLYQGVFLAMALPQLTAAVAGSTIALAVPLTLIWYALANLSFLLYPGSLMSRGIGDIQYIGRQLFTLLVQLTLASLAAILAVAFGYWLAILWTLNLLQFVFLIALILLIEAGLLVGLLALVFKRFDPSRADLS